MEPQSGPKTVERENKPNHETLAFRIFIARNPAKALADSHLATAEFNRSRATDSSVSSWR
jgi:hypothetical protein